MDINEAGMIRILLAEDEPVLARNIARSLERMGDRVAPTDRRDLEQRLMRESLRRDLELPTLSLFAVADPPSAD